MIIKIHDEQDIDVVTNVLKSLKVNFTLEDDSFLSYVKDEMTFYSQCIYNDIIGPNTLEKIEEEVLSDIEQREITIVGDFYHKVAEKYTKYYDMDTIGTYVISNNTSIQFKEIDGDYAICIDPLKELHKVEVQFDDNGDPFVKIYNIQIYLKEVV